MQARNRIVVNLPREKFEKTCFELSVVINSLEKKTGKKVKKNWTMGQGMLAEEGHMSPHLTRLVHERLQAEVQALKVKFSLCFVAILFALAGAAFLWGGLKQKRKDRRSRSRSVSLYDVGQEPTAGQSRAARHLLRNRVRREPARVHESAGPLYGACVCTALTRRPAYLCSIRAPHR
jgi:hypothetical protein